MFNIVMIYLHMDVFDIMGKQDIPMLFFHYLYNFAQFVEMFVNKIITIWTCHNLRIHIQ